MHPVGGERGTASGTRGRDLRERPDTRAVRTGACRSMRPGRWRRRECAPRPRTPAAARVVDPLSTGARREVAIRLLGGAQGQPQLQTGEPRARATPRTVPGHRRHQATRTSRHASGGARARGSRGLYEWISPGGRLDGDVIRSDTRSQSPVRRGWRDVGRSHTPGCGALVESVGRDGARGMGRER